VTEDVLSVTVDIADLTRAEEIRARYAAIVECITRTGLSRRGYFVATRAFSSSNQLSTTLSSRTSG
jgi:hypothetical protein